MDVKELTQRSSFHFIVVSGVIYLLYKLYNLAFTTDIAKLKGIVEIPGSIPFYGHLKLLGDDHASAFSNWAEKLHADVLQARLGNRRIIVLNTFKAAQEWIVNNASATIDRPLFYTFHGVLSSTQGGTVGTSPWNESTKRRRTAVGTIMTRPAILKFAPMLDLESASLIEGMHTAANLSGGSKSIEVDPRIFFQRQSLNITLMQCYGTRLANIDDPLLHEILQVAHSVSTFRSTNKNPQDYVPFLRYLPENERTKLAVANRNRRDLWLNELLRKVETAIEEGKNISCLSEGLLKDTGSAKLTKDEIKSINVSLVSGGFETLSMTGLAGLGFLSSAEGQAIQERAYQAIMAVYSSPEEAWHNCIVEETVPYIVALVREMLRYYAAIQLLPPRQTMKEFTWRGLHIPKGLSVYMNAQAINHDKIAYGPDAEIFRPERWLEHDTKYPVPLPYHYSFGAGARLCPAVALSQRALYSTFVRLLLHFRVTASDTMPPSIGFVDFNEERDGATSITKRYKVKLEPRGDLERLHVNLRASREATAGVGE